MRLWNIGIIGGGPGGPITAYSLLKLASAPVNITLFEASSRLGGKILTPQFQSAPVRYEAGAAEFYDYSVFEVDSLRALIRELGAACFSDGRPGCSDGRSVSFESGRFSGSLWTTGSPCRRGI